MKVLMISGTYPDLRCGVGDYVGKLTENLISCHVEVLVLTSDDASIRREDFVYPLIKRWKMPGIPRILNFIKKANPDIINLQMPSARYRSIINSANLLPLFAKIFCDASSPFAVTVHDYAITRWFLRPFFLPLFLFSDLIIITNDNDEAEILRMFPFLRRKVRKIAMGPTIEIADIPSDAANRLRAKIAYKETDRLISTFGFIERAKHLDLLLHVFSKLSQHDKDLKLLVMSDVRRDDDVQYRDSVISLAGTLGLKERICWIGFSKAEEISFYLSLSKLGLLFYERGASFRRSTLINYIIRQVPVVTNINTSYGKDNLLVESGIVLTVDSLETEKVCEKARLALYDEETRSMLKKRMAETKDMFNWQRHTNDVIEAYEKAMKSKRG